MPLTRPPKSQKVSEVGAHEAPAGTDVTEYCVIAEPFVKGAVHETFVMVPLPMSFTITRVGTKGLPEGVTAELAVEGKLAPLSLSATTVKVYAVLLFNSEIAQVVAVVVAHVLPSGFAVTV